MILYGCGVVLCEWKLWEECGRTFKQGADEKNIPSIVITLGLRPTLQRPNTPQKHKVSCVDARKNLKTVSCCWQPYTILNTHAQRHKTKNMFFVVFCSYERVSPSGALV